jgi:hypothetical protein
MVDLICDEDLLPFYERLGMTASTFPAFSPARFRTGVTLREVA